MPMQVCFLKEFLLTNTQDTREARIMETGVRPKNKFSEEQYKSDQIKKKDKSTLKSEKNKSIKKELY